MMASRTETFVPRVLPALALLLCLGLFAGTCSTGNPGTIFSPTDPGDGDGDGGGGGGPLEDGPSAAPIAGAVLQVGKPAFEASAPMDSATEVDIHAPVVLWFSESLRTDTVTAASLILRPKLNPEFPVTTTNSWLAGDRCLIMEPIGTLSPGVEFEVFATDAITDLEGERITLPRNGRLAKFTTSTSFGGQAPEVLGSFPPAGSVDIPNDASVILVFSKAMDFTGITDAVGLTNRTTLAPANYDLSADLEFRHAGDRVFEFPHLDDTDDLGADLRIHVGTSVTDAEFVPQPLAASFTADWTSLNFGRPQSIGFDAFAFGGFDPAVNLANQDVFPVRVDLPVSVAPSDGVTLLVHEEGESAFVQSVLPAGAGLVDFTLDLTDGTGGDLFNPSTNLILAGYVERNGRRSSVQVFRDEEGIASLVPHDLVRPLLFNYGPPVGQFGSQFVSDVPRFRPYGRASERVALVTSSFPPTVLEKTRTNPEPPASNFFVGPFFDPLVVTEGPLLFDITLTDIAGNPASSPSPGSVAFRGFIGATPLAGGGEDLRVVAFDRDSLFLLSGATMHIEDLGGGNEDSGSAGSDGSFTFAGRSGAQTITIQVPGYDSVSVVGFDATEISVPLPAASRTVANTAPLVSGLTSGILTVSSNLMAESNGEVDPDGQQDYDLENIFGTINTRLDRLGWFAGFHDVEDFDALDRYYRFYGVDGRILLEPSTGSTLVPPVMPMVESSNQIALTTDFIYPLRISSGAGYGALADSGALVGTVIPGLPGFIGLGAGSVDLTGGGVNGDAEVELSLHDLAVTEGASSTDVLLQVSVEDDSGNLGLARVSAPLAAAPADVFLTLPDVPVDGAWGSIADYPFTHAFTNTLGGAGGFFRLTVEDTAATPNRWHFWIASSVSAVDPLVMGFPTLKEDVASGVGIPPLEMAPGGSWVAFAEAFEMPVGFLEIGFFFSELERDTISWSRSAPGATLDF
ncbi:MAG: Ig-like domain-containing domain [Planctomycetota bacterium]